MIENTIARRYAAALFDVATETNCLEAVFSDMALLTDVSKENRDFTRMLHSPIINADKKTAILTSLFSGKVQSVSLQFMVLVTKKRRESIVDLIAEAFVAQYKAFKDIHVITVLTAQPLNEASRKEILNSVSTEVSGTIELVEKVDPQLIGGYKLLYDNMVFDASVAKQIQKLKREFKDNLYIKQF
jgi:F-type H+-transporting ATPase subunit delta